PDFTNWYLATQHSAWNQAGADQAGSDRGINPTAVQPLPQGQLLTFDVTSDINRWLRGDANQGWLLLLQNSPGLILNLASADHPDIAMRPALILDLASDTILATPTATPTPVATPTPSGSTGSTTFTYDLQEGWNAISIPLIPANPALPNVLDSIAGQYESVWWYDNSQTPGRWRHYRPDDASSDLFAIPQLRGVWLKMKAPATLRVFGLRPSTTVIHLEPGWNQIGFPSESPQPVASTLAAITGSYDRVYVWDNPSQQWRYFIPGAKNNTLHEFRPGDALWIRAIRPTNLIVIN
ncbi:MAG: hypothetical protein GXP38_13695, partial [Chloroflexi bacterium]|nr:hypothetical protein [Chloroflexota bacterium]